MSLSVPVASSEEVRAYQQMSFRLLDLPSELRAAIYDIILPGNTTVRLNLKYHPQMLSTRTQGLRGYPLMNYPPGIPMPAFDQNIHTSISLMKACRTTHTELAPRFYHTLRFQPCPASVANFFRESLHPSVRPVIDEIQLADYSYTRHYGEKEEKIQLQAAIAGFVGLRHLVWDGLDATANASNKSTVWKPQELRRLDIVLKSSANLHKVFYNPPSTLRHAFVRLTGKDGVAGPEAYVSHHTTHVLTRIRR